MPHKLCPAAQAAFISHYESLKASIASDEVILFGDGVHPTQSTKVSYGWIKKGKRKAVSTTASRTRLNILGAIELNNLGRALTKSYERINADSLIEFLTDLRAAYPNSGRLHWIIDNAGYHKAKIVKERADELNIELHFLPPYSPNLNPIERLWQVMNKHVRNNCFFHSAKEFRQKINEFFEKTLPKIACSLDSTINDNFQRFDRNDAVSS